MEQKTEMEKQMRQYLLGQSPEAEKVRLEERFFSDDEYFEQLLAVEDDLIDEYVHGDLSPAERASFEQHFLAIPQRRQRVAFAQALRSKVSESRITRARGTAPAGSARPSWWASLRDGLRFPNSALRFSGAAVALLLLIGSAWLVVKTTALRRQLEQLQAERQTLQHQEQAAQRARSEALAAQLQQERAARALAEPGPAKPPSLPAVLSLVLSPGLVRDGGGPKRLVIPPDTPLLQLQLDLEESYDYRSYHAVLRTSQGEAIASQTRLLAQPIDAGQAVVWWLPPRLLTPGEYNIMLRGTTAGGKSEAVGEYYFNIVRK